MGKPVKISRRQPSRGLLPLIGIRICGIAVLSIALGLVFNASNPLGIQWQSQAIAAAPPAEEPALEPAIDDVAAEPVPVPALPVQAATSTTGQMQAEQTPEVASNIVAIGPATARLEVPSRRASPSFPEPQLVHRAPITPFNDPVPMPPMPPAVPMVNSTVVSSASASVVPVSAPAPETQGSPGDPKPIHWTEVKQLLAAGKTVLVDARPVYQFEASHIPGAVSLPNGSPPEAVAEFMAKHPLDTTLIVYCSAQSCGLSRQLAFRLAHQHKYANVRYMPGGLQEWQQFEVKQ